MVTVGLKPGLQHSWHVVSGPTLLGLGFPPDFLTPKALQRVLIQVSCVLRTSSPALADTECPGHSHTTGSIGRPAEALTLPTPVVACGLSWSRPHRRMKSWTHRCQGPGPKPSGDPADPWAYLLTE